VTAGSGTVVDAPVDEEVRVARAGLLRVAEPPSPVLSAFVDQLGPLVAWERICNGNVPVPVRAVVGPRLADVDARDMWARAEMDLLTADRSGARLVIPEDGEWPAVVMGGFVVAPELVPPLGLWVRGGALLPGPWGAVTVVGSRASTSYGARVAADLASGLASAGRCVVSGAAFGIDAAAHRGALAVNDFAGAGPVTVAVLACGIDRAYPAAHQVLLDAIAERGAVVSEYPPGTTPARHRFLVRNRLIAALGEATVVVEAGRRSGSTATFRAARALNRVTAAVPGPVTSALSAGCHELIAAEGALLVTGAADVLGLLAGGAGVGADDSASPEVRPTDKLSPELAVVYEALPGRGSRDLSALAAEAGLFADDTMAALAELELLGMATRDGAAWKRVRAARNVGR
jgi:DNA processing protein